MGYGVRPNENGSIPNMKLVGKIINRRHWIDYKNPVYWKKLHE